MLSLDNEAAEQFVLLRQQGTATICSEGRDDKVALP